MPKVYMVLVSSYYNEEYWDIYTEVDSVYSQKDKAEEYIKNIENIKWNEKAKCWKIGDEDEDAYAVRFYDIKEVEVR